jgi:hypothetical protein
MVDLKKNETPQEKEVYAVIKAIYNGKTYTSVPLLLSNTDATESTETIRYLTERGTTDLTMFKFPLSNEEYLIFSRQQLNETLFSIEMSEHLNPNNRPAKKGPKKAA